MLIVVFWVVMPFTLVGGNRFLEEHYFNPEDGDGMFVQNAGNHLQSYSP
jgi:hypothetical protein